MKFFFHYNKPASRAAGKPQVTLHYNKQCLLLDNLHCYVPISGRIRNRQPYYVICGDASSVKIKNKIATIR